MDQDYEIQLNCDNSFYSTIKNPETGHTTIILEDRIIEISTGKLIIGDTQMLASNGVNYLWVIPTTVLLTFVATFLAFASVLLLRHRNKKKHSREFIIA